MLKSNLFSERYFYLTPLLIEVLYTRGIWFKSMSLKEFVIIKFGGSVITDKSTPFRARPETIDQLSQNIAAALQKKEMALIIVHGGGSFGHPLAHQYQINKGIDPSIPNQIFGIARTHHAMEDLNRYIVDSLIANSLPVMTFSTFSSFIKEINSNVKITCGPQLVAALSHQMIPVFYGDILFAENGNARIISGDEIILTLCEFFGEYANKEYRISKVIFAFDQDGVLRRKSAGEPAEIEVISEIAASHITTISPIQLQDHIDVTGSIGGKFRRIEQIGRLGLSTQIINGNCPQRLFSAMLGNPTLSTTIIP
jgi:isopentenyl phosphate kinase